MTLDKLPLYWEMYLHEVAQYSGKDYDADAARGFLVALDAVPIVDKTPLTENGETVGFMYTIDYKPTNALFILDVFVVPAFRRKGIAKRAIKEAIKPGTEKIIFSINAGNPAAQFFADLMTDVGFVYEAYSQTNDAEFGATTEYQYARGKAN